MNAVSATAALIVGAAMAVSVAPRAQSVVTHPFLIAYSGWGGALVPIGRYTGTSWINTWPEPAESSVRVPRIEDIPVAWLGQPVPRTWTLYLEGRPTRITVAGTRRGDQGGCTSPAVLTIVRPPVVPDTAYDGGLAVDTNQSIEEIRPALPADAIWQQLAPIVERTFGAYEPRAWDGDAGARLRETLEQEGVKWDAVPFTIDRIDVPVTDPTPATYYFGASKRVRAARGEIGVTVSGWLRKDVGGRWPPMQVGAHVIGDDAQYDRRPLGLLRVIARRFWVMSVTGWESGAFEIDEATGTDVIRLLSVSNGAC